MLIDAGDNDKATLVQNYLQKQGIRDLQYVIGTHPDADHIGGLDVIIYKFNCEHILMPWKENDTATYRDVLSAVDQKRYTIEHPALGDTFMLGDAVCTVVGPVGKYQDNNNNSISLLVQYGNNTFLFMGDTELDGEAAIMSAGVNVDADVVKLGHHGSRTSSTKAFLDRVTPQYAIISCGKDNSYGHPHTETLESVKNMNVQMFRTDEQGTIVCSSDGSSIVFNKTPSENYKNGRGEEYVPYTGEYVLNTRSKKIHLPSCESAKSMSEKNKQIVTLDKESLHRDGYTDCGYCRP